MPLMAAGHERVMLRLELVVGFLRIGVQLIQMRLVVLNILMQGVVTLLGALGCRVERVLHILAVLHVILPSLLVVMADRVGILMRVLMQLLDMLLGGVDVRLDLLIRLVHVVDGAACLVVAADAHIVIDALADGGPGRQSVRGRCDFIGRSHGRQSDHSDGQDSRCRYRCDAFPHDDSSLLLAYVAFRTCHIPYVIVGGLGARINRWEEAVCLVFAISQGEEAVWPSFDDGDERACRKIETVIQHACALRIAAEQVTHLGHVVEAAEACSAGCGEPHLITFDGGGDGHPLSGMVGDLESLQSQGGGSSDIADAIKRGRPGFLCIIRHFRARALRVVRPHRLQPICRPLFEGQCDRTIRGMLRAFEKRSVGHGGAVFRTILHRKILCCHARSQNILAERMDRYGRAFIRIQRNRHCDIRRVPQIRAAERGPLCLAYILCVLVSRPTRELHVQERQIAAPEHGTILVDERGHLRFVLHGRGVIRGVVATLIPQHARHMEPLQRRDMVRVNVASVQMPSDGGAAPRGLDDADRHVRMLRPQLHGELLGQIAQMLGTLGISIQPFSGLPTDIAQWKIGTLRSVVRLHELHVRVGHRFRQVALRD